MHNRELTESELAEIARLRRKNYSNREISRLMGISLYRATIIGKRCEELEALRKENASLKKTMVKEAEQSFWVSVERSPAITAEQHEFLAKLRLIAQFDAQLSELDKQAGAYLTGVALTEIRDRIYNEIEDLAHEIEKDRIFVDYLSRFSKLYPTKTLRGLIATLGVKLE